MDAPDLYGEINEEPVPEGLTDAPQCEELYKSWKHQRQEKDRLLETIERLAEENKRIMRERDEFEEECNTLQKRNTVYKKNARMIFSVCRVELSKRERRIETLERRIASYGIVDGNSYSAAANSNEDDFTTQVNLNLDTELKFTGILSELNHGLSRNKALREDNNPNLGSHPERDHPFDCRPFRGPKTPPTPSCKPSAARTGTKASSAERYDRKRDSRSSSSYHTSQSKYRRYDDYSEDTHDAYQKLDRHEHVDDHHYRDSRDRRHIRRDDNYQHESSHSEHSYGRYRESGSKESSMNRPDPRIHPRNDRIPDRDRERDREYESDRFQGRNSYDKSQYRDRGEYKRGVDDYCRPYDGGSDQQMLREDRDLDACYSNGMRRTDNQTSHEGYDDYVDRRDSNRERDRDRDRDLLNPRDRYSDRRGYDERDGRSYPGAPRSGHNSRRYVEDDVAESGRGNSRGRMEETIVDEKPRRHGSSDSRSRDRFRDGSEPRPEHSSYLAKRPEKRAIHAHVKEIEKSVPSQIVEKERRPHKRTEVENDDCNIDGRQHDKVSSGTYRYSKDSANDERYDDAGDVHTHTPIIPSSNSSETSHELRVRDKRHLHTTGNEEAKSKLSTSSPKTSKSPTSIVKPSETLDGLVKTLADLSHGSSSDNSKESFTEADNYETSEPPTQMPTNSPVSKTKGTKSGAGIETTTRSKMRKVRESKPILFTKVKEPQKAEELDSIQSSLDVSFFRDVESYSGKEIYHRNGRKEGLPKDDFVVAEGVRIQRKESEDAEEDNFVLGTDCNKDVDLDKPTETTFTKRMRERWEKEEEAAANLQKLRDLRSDDQLVSEANPAPADDDEEDTVAPEVIDRPANYAGDEKPPRATELETVKEPDVQEKVAEDSDDKLDQCLTNGLRRRSIDRSSEGTRNEHQSRDDLDDKVLPESNIEPEVITPASPTGSEEYADDEQRMKSQPRRLPSPIHDSVEEEVDFDDRNNEEVDFDERDNGEAGEAEAMEEEEDPITDDRRSESEYSDYDSGGESEGAPVKESIEALEWDYDDDLHLEEVDTTNVADDRSEGEYSADIQREKTDELEEGEMEEGEILDDSENENVSGSGTGKVVEVKPKKKKRPKKTKIKKVGGKAHGKGKKAKVLMSESHAANRAHKPQRSSEPTARQVKPSGRRSQSGSSTRSQSTHPTPFRGARHHESIGAEIGPRAARLAASRQFETMASSHGERRLPSSQVASRRQRPSAQDSVNATRRGEGVRAPMRGRRGKPCGGLKDTSSTGYRGRSPPTRQGNCMPSKDFRSRRHVLADRHRARR